MLGLGVSVDVRRTSSSVAVAVVRSLVVAGFGEFDGVALDLFLFGEAERWHAWRLTFSFDSPPLAGLCRKVSIT